MDDAITGTEQAGIEKAEVLLLCANLDEMVNFFEELGFRLNSIFPADAPQTCTMSGYGLNLRIQLGEQVSPGQLCLHSSQARQPIQAPNGTHIFFETATQPTWEPCPPFQIHRLTGEDSWHVGRAGMQYRDLIPDRLGGRAIASHIRIQEGGPVPDYVHFHQVRFQMIFCVKGWVKVVYEDQGPPMTMKAGDCFLQPPTIRHRVLTCSPGLEVVEVGCPAQHPTLVEHELALPTGNHLPERLFGGQNFVFHQAQSASWTSWRQANYQYRDTGIGAATRGLARAGVIRPGENASAAESPSHPYTFLFVLQGETVILVDGDRHHLQEGDCLVVSEQNDYRLQDSSDNLEILEVGIPNMDETAA